MKIITVKPSDTGEILPPETAPSCCARPATPSPLRAPGPDAIRMAAASLKGLASSRPHWIAGGVHTPAGTVPVVTSEWTAADRRGAIRCRTGSFRMDYAVPPGLYAIGAPDAESDVFVSANYKFSFDILRRSLAGTSGWILVLDTKGINVWCAAGEGTFGTEELVRRVNAAGLSAVVSHRRLIVPQLGAVGVSAHQVRKRTAFRVHFGPVDASDLPRYLENGRKATPAMREVRFGWRERLVLTPIELLPVMKKFPVIALIILFIFGLQPSGIIFRSAWFDGWPFLVLALAAALAGALVTPLLLPVIPSRSFAIKGWIAGMAIVAPIVIAAPLLWSNSWFLKASALILFPLLSSYLGLQFTGATTFTGISGVRKEIRIALPLYIAGVIASAVLIILNKLQSWGFI